MTSGPVRHELSFRKLHKNQSGPTPKTSNSSRQFEYNILKFVCKQKIEKQKNSILKSLRVSISVLTRTYRTVLSIIPGHLLNLRSRDLREVATAVTTSLTWIGSPTVLLRINLKGLAIPSFLYLFFEFYRLVNCLRKFLFKFRALVIGRPVVVKRL